MAIQPEDNVTRDLLDSQPTAQIIDLDEVREDDILARKHGLVKVSAYIKDEKKAAKKTANADRQKKFADQKEAAGEVKTWIPREVSDGIKAAGSFDEWKKSLIQVTGDAPEPAPVVEIREVERIVEVDRIVERVVEVSVPADLTGEQKRLISKGRAVESLTGWQRLLAKKLLKI